MVKPNLL